MTSDEIRTVSARTLEKWHALPESEQTRIVMQAVYAACLHDSYIKRGNPAEYFGAAWIEIDERLNFACVIRINAARTKEGKSPATIGRIVNQLVRSMIMREHYARSKDFSGRVDVQHADDIDNQSNDNHNYNSNRIDQLPAPATAAEPEAFVFAEDSTIIKWVKAQSHIDQMIIRALLNWKTEKEIAAELGVSQSTISRHRTAMQGEMINNGYTRGYIKKGA